MLARIHHQIDFFAGFSTQTIQDNDLHEYEQALHALLQNIEAAIIEITSRRNAIVKDYFQQYGFRLSWRRLRTHNCLSYNRNITDVSFLVVLPVNVDGDRQYPYALDVPVSLRVFDRNTGKLLVDWGVFADVQEAIDMLPHHYKDIRS